MQRNCLETNQVIATRHGRGDSGSPRRVLGNHLPVTPVAVIHGARDESRLINLEPFQARSVGAGAGRSGALGQVDQLHADPSEN